MVDDLKDSSKENAVFYHHAEMVDSQALEIVAHEACQKLEQLYPKARGWRLRSVAINPLNSSVFDRFRDYDRLGLLASSNEPTEEVIVIDLDNPDTKARALLNLDEPLV